MKETKDFYLDGLRRMNWDTFRFGSYNLKDWHNVEEYIKKCNDMLVTPTLERLFDIECRNLFREGKVIIDGRILTIAEARTYVEQKIKNQLRTIYNFNGN